MSLGKITATYWGGLIIVVVWCIASTMEYNDQISAKAKPDRYCEEHSAEYGKEWVTMCKIVKDAK